MVGGASEIVYSARFGLLGKLGYLRIDDIVDSVLYSPSRAKSCRDRPEILKVQSAQDHQKVYYEIDARVVCVLTLKCFFTDNCFRLNQS